MRDELRIGIIGSGNIATGHVRRFRAIPGVRLVACCDILKKAARSFATAYDIPAWYPSFEQMLDAEDLDGVAVTASDAAHAPASIAALKRGLHVLCEKPMATSLAEAKQMLRVARKAGTVHMINFSYRAMPALERARILVADGALGQVRHVEASYLQSWLAHPVWGDWRDHPRLLWRMSKQHHGGTLADLGCHLIDMTLYAAGDIARVDCRMKSFSKGMPRNRCKGYTLDADDSFFATVAFAEGGLGTVHSTRWATGHRNALRLRIFGDKGALVLDNEVSHDTLQVCIGPFHGKNLLWNTLPAGLPERSIQERFVSGIRSGRAEAPTFEDGCRVQACLSACIASDAAGRPRTLRH